MTKEPNRQKVAPRNLILNNMLFNKELQPKLTNKKINFRI